MKILLQWQRIPILAASFLQLIQLANAVPLQLPFNEWPMIEAHDAASGYLTSGWEEIAKWTITQPLDGKTALSTQLGCGARAFDWRPEVDKTGHLIMHHGAVAISHPMDLALQELIDWASQHRDPEDLIVLAVSNCQGANSTNLTASMLKQLGVPSVISDCRTLHGLTLGDALNMSQLPRGGHLLPIFDCIVSNWVPQNACSGYVAEEYTEINTNTLNKSLGFYTCYETYSSKAFPLNRLFTYLGNVSLTGPPPSGLIWSMQALWQETKASIAIGELLLSSLLKDEERSGLNQLVAKAVSSGQFPNINLLEVNNVCDAGPALFEAIRSHVHRLEKRYSSQGTSILV